MKPEDVDWYADLQWDSSAAGGLVDELASYPFAVRDKRVLDLAGGPGAFTKVIAEAGAAEVVWQDVDERFLEIAQARCDVPNVTFVIADMDDAAAADDTFDVVFLRTAIYWSRDEAALIQALGERVRRGGWLVIRSPSWRRPLRTIRAPHRAIAHLFSPAIAVVLRRKPLTTLWTSRTLTRRRLRRAGFRIERVTTEPLAFTLVAQREP